MNDVASDLPRRALSVRQPWAWAIIHGGKDIENRTLGSIRSGGMETGRICIHAATGMREEEYRWGLYKLQQVGVTAPHPAELVRGGLIGVVDVVDIVSESGSPWFGGPWGLVLENATPIGPFPAHGALGYFEWVRTEAFSPALPWMERFAGGTETGALFPDLEPSFRGAPPKPFGG
ncbi:hypothetical protein AADZ90_009835 [Aestuariibius sp. 2305UL40-4]|uniref:hypothetical protein n=1 Tax=Aestuariibius violaceus TaxID=3234132 RepID=UPI00345E7545